MPITPVEASLMMPAMIEAVVAAFLMRREILLRKQAERVTRESQQRTVDPLTVLANRSRVVLESASGVREALESQSPYSLCLCDVDKLKHMNDTYGHHADDEGRSYGVTATFGIAGLSPGMTEAALFEAADQALYAAKRRSGNAVEVAV